MAETREAKQYKIYTLHANVLKVIGKKDGKEVTRTDRVPVAIFDDKALCDKFQAENEAKLKGQQSYEVVEDWIEHEPAADRFSLPFNPAPNAPQSEEKAEDDTNHNGDN